MTTCKMQVVIGYSQLSEKTSPILLFYEVFIYLWVNSANLYGKVYSTSILKATNLQDIDG